MNVKRLTQLALLTALASIIFIVELQLPDLTPIPGMKLGLANIITVFAVYRFRAGEVCLIAAARIFIGALFSGNFPALIYSFSGAALCLLGMLLVRRIIPERYIILCSVIGAMLHNIGQTAAAVVMMRSFAVAAYLPVLICAGSIAGVFTGACAFFLLKRGIFSLEGDSIKLPKK